MTRAIINIRGTNGSGKTTLVRELLGGDPYPVDLVEYLSPTKRQPERKRWVEGCVARDHMFIAVGSYRQGCGGMDTVPSFDLQQQGVFRASNRSSVRHVLCEGVLASTVAGSWRDFFLSLRQQRVIVAYLDTPLELCLERIRQRQRASGRGEREIKQELVESKVRAIAATRPKFEEAGIRTITLRHGSAAEDLKEALL